MNHSPSIVLPLGAALAAQTPPCIVVLDAALPDPLPFVFTNGLRITLF
jgi:hypothetical protein